MLRKLFGFEMKEMGRILIPFCLAAMGLSILSGLSLSRLETQPIVNGILVMLMILALLAAALATFVLVLLRFSRNLLGNEGYFMFSIPASLMQHIHAKGLASILWTALVGVTACVSAFLLYSFGVLPETRHLISPYLRMIRMRMEDGTIQFILSFLLMCLCWAASLIYKFYAAISLGHLWRGHRRLGAVLAFIGLEILQSQGQQAVFQLYPELPADPSLHAMASFLLFPSACMAALAVVYSLVAWFILNRKLALE